MERCKHFKVVFNCLFFTPATVTVEVKKSFYYVIPRILRILKESRALNYKCNLEGRHNGDLLKVFGKC